MVTSVELVVVSPPSGQYGPIAGTHSAGSIVCTGMTQEDFRSTGVTDTVFAVGEGALGGEVRPRCFDTLLFGLCAERERPWVELFVDDQVFEAVGEGVELNGSFGWQSLDAVRIHGTWTARR